MFCGSSCAQMISSQAAVAGDELPRLLRPGTGRAARCAQPRRRRRRRAARGRRCRSRACRAEDEPAHASRGRRSGRRSPAGTRPSLSSSSVRCRLRSRSSPFGVITISGRAVGSSAWRRSRWNYCAAVVGLTIRMFSCAASWRNRSSRALECSGPLPSYPCGRSSVSLDVWPPLREAGDDELVDRDLRAVDEVAELRLPEHERLGRGDRVAVLEADAPRTRRAAS